MHFKTTNKHTRGANDLNRKRPGRICLLLVTLHHRVKDLSYF